MITLSRLLLGVSVALFIASRPLGLSSTAPPHFVEEPGVPRTLH